MSRDDLLADLQGEVGARPAAPATPPPSVPTGAQRLTPTFALSVTPLRWQVPSVGPVPTGLGVAVRVGPLQVSLGIR
ncbi:MAG TPA: hypothetical protein VNU66_03830 [Mycobacteriales bacterium]|nr:hypothetical protein [Mycobacteriales bacterium]